MATREKRKRTATKVFDESLPVHFQTPPKTKRATAKKSAAYTLSVDLGQKDYELWSQVQHQNSLTSDGDVVVFLLRCYQKTNGQGLLCGRCQKPVLEYPFFCGACSAYGGQGEAQIKIERDGDAPATSFSPMDMAFHGSATSSYGAAESAVASTSGASNTFGDDAQMTRVAYDDNDDNDDNDHAGFDDGQSYFGAAADILFPARNAEELLQAQNMSTEPKKKQLRNAHFKAYCIDENCDKTFNTNVAMINHFRNKHCKIKGKIGQERGQKACPLCDYTTNYFYNLARHLMTHAPPSKKQLIPVVRRKPKSYICDRCARHFTRIGRLRSHREACGGKKCPLCGIDIPYKRSLKIHLSNNCVMSPEVKQKLEQEFPCPAEDCDRIFKRKTVMVDHYKGMHSDNRKQCKKCGRTFKWRAGLANHRCDGTEGRTDLQCQTCGKQFQHQRSYMQHKCKPTHGPVRCKDENCFKRFISENKMRQHHKKVHLGVKHECPACGRRCKCMKKHRKICSQYIASLDQSDLALNLALPSLPSTTVA